MLLLAGLIFAAACTGSPDAPVVEGTPMAAGSPSATAGGGAPKGPPGPPPTGGAAPDLDQGQQHPPLPADNPVWDWDAGGFVPEYGWYGEHSWADVRMRVAGHISAAGRDKARLLAEQGRVEEALAALAVATDANTRHWPHQLARLDLNVARALGLVGKRAEACARAEAALELADRCGFRYYSLRAHQLLARLSEDEATAQRHESVAGSLARSLAANLPREDAAVFLELHGLTPRGGPPRA